MSLCIFIYLFTPPSATATVSFRGVGTRGDSARANGRALVSRHSGDKSR